MVIQCYKFDNFLVATDNKKDFLENVCHRFWALALQSQNILFSLKISFYYRTRNRESLFDVGIVKFSF